MNSPWRNVNTTEDAAFLMQVSSAFKNSILREAKFCNGTYVDESLRLHLGGESFFRCFFQSQRLELPVFELVFGSVSLLQLTCDCDNELEEAFLEVDADGILWTDRDPSQGLRGSFICSKRLSWRPLPSWQGQRERYTGVTESDLNYYEPEPSSDNYSIKLPPRLLN